MKDLYFDTKRLSDSEIIKLMFDDKKQAKTIFDEKIVSLTAIVKIGDFWLEKRKKQIIQSNSEMELSARFCVLCELNYIYQKHKENKKQLKKFQALSEICKSDKNSIKNILDKMKIEYARKYSIRRLIERFCDNRKKNSICPFHKETLPSLHIYDDTNSFYCFGCKKGGDPIRFIQLLRGYNFSDAVNFINNL